MKFQTLDFFRANDFMIVSEFYAAVMFNIGDIILANHLEIPIGKKTWILSSRGSKTIGLGGYEMDLTPFVTRKVIILMVTVTGWERCNPNESCKHVFTHIDIQVNTETDVFSRCLALALGCFRYVCYRSSHTEVLGSG